MLVLLPPSETKRTGGDGPPLTPGALSFAELEPLRTELVDELVALAADVGASRAALGLSPRQDGEVARNAALRASPTLPALHRYTGVLYDALDVASLRGVAAARARARLAVGSALFGLLRATDPVPAYRLSAGSALPGRPTLAARWRPLLDPVLTAVAAGETAGRDAGGAERRRAPGRARRGLTSAQPDGVAPPCACCENRLPPAAGRGTVCVDAPAGPARGETERGRCDMSTAARDVSRTRPPVPPA